MGIIDLWLPILAAAVIMYFASTLIWVLFKWHNADYKKTNDEEGVRAALRGNKPGFYLLPYSCHARWHPMPTIWRCFALPVLWRL